MEMFEKTKLWSTGLSDRLNDPQKIVRDRLRSALLDIRTRAGHLTAEIPRALPWLTVHDLSHIDALWEMGDLVLGDELLNREPRIFDPRGGFRVGSCVHSP